MDTSDEKFKNHLANEKSPYLLQHANNPVDWYPWGEDAFQKARDEDKPIFLSIGYSTCHWCHVMARESFQDPEIGELLNHFFVSVKVDREERPDLDSIYMTVCQMITGSGGWPLTIILTPDLKPFFAGTYFPKEGMGRGAGLKDLILNVHDLWDEKRDDIFKSADDISVTLSNITKTKTGELLDPSILETAYNSLLEIFDPERGGFGVYQKFPTPHNLLFLLRYWKSTQQEEALSMVEDTLQAMRMGGIWDHVGYGFHRYTVDPDWLVPHFEKMLYDQALIALAYTEAYQATGNREYLGTATNTLEYVIRDMKSPEGAFFSAEDADSEGVEGKFYVWNEKEINEVLSPDEALIAFKTYHVTREGNFGEERTGKRTGSNILHLEEPISIVAEDMGLKMADLQLKLDSIREKLFMAREDRVHPHKDDKILTDWNGLMIAALAKINQSSGNTEFLQVAEDAVEFITQHMYQDGILWHRYREGEVKVEANLDDYAFLVWGLLELYQASLKTNYLKLAIDLNKEMVDKFSDPETGGFFFTSKGVTDVPVRKKESYDSALPSGNSVAYLNLLRLSTILEDDQYQEQALSLEKTFANVVKRSPTAHVMLLSGLEYRLGPSYGVVISGDKGHESADNMTQALGKMFLPNVVWLLHLSDDDWLPDLVPSLQDKAKIDGMTTAYVCGGGACYPPIRSLEGLRALFEK